MEHRELTPERLTRAGIGSFFRPKDLEAIGIGSGELRTLLDAGVVERLSRGLYRLSAAELTEDSTLAAVCAKAPKAILCLLTALSYHQIGTQMPRQVWIGIPHKAREPRLPEVELRIVRFSGASLRYGVETVHLDGVPARITNPARTVVDCFRFRRRVGRAVALEALKEALAEGKATVTQIWRTAEMCRAKTLIEPYLVALSA